jgi:hypothetical protein
MRPAAESGRHVRKPECGTDIGKVKSPLAGLRFHDLRHDAITTLAESLASDQVIMGVAGHVSLKMLQHYSHVRLEAKKNATDALSLRQPKSTFSGEFDGGNVTNRVTKKEWTDEVDPEVLCNVVELSGIEPLASSLRTRRSPS